MNVRMYSVSICDACIRLDGEECHTAACIFFLRGMDEVREYLNRMLIRPIVGGEPVFTSEEIFAMAMECHEEN
jgi:hypothetical protein